MTAVLTETNKRLHGLKSPLLDIYYHPITVLRKPSMGCLYWCIYLPDLGSFLGYEITREKRINILTASFSGKQKNPKQYLPVIKT